MPNGSWYPIDQNSGKIIALGFLTFGVAGNFVV